VAFEVGFKVKTEVKFEIEARTTGGGEETIAKSQRWFEGEFKD